MKENKKTLNVHFIGIGGASMSSLARYLNKVGFSVSGSDLVCSEVVGKLKDEGITFFCGHDEKNVNGKDVVVYNDAIKLGNPELSKAISDKIYVLRRAELLKMISENFKRKIGVGGCHGKTTVTCMLAHVFDQANERFSAHIGGFDLKYGNSVVKGNKYFISEVCEYKKNIDLFDADFAICLNAEADHMDCYADKSELLKTYYNFLKKAYRAVICADDMSLCDYSGTNAITYGLNPKSDFRAINVTVKDGKYSFDVCVFGAKSVKINLKVFGGHNVLNALAVFACSYLCGIDVKTIKRGIEDFKGVERRFEQIGKINFAAVYADYAHHPTEIAEAVKTIAEIERGRVFTVFQPHTYSRTIFLKDKFIKTLSEIEKLCIYKTYSAREEYNEEGSALLLSKSLLNSVYFDRIEALLAYLYDNVTKGDVVLILGAGDLEIEIKKRLNKE